MGLDVKETPINILMVYGKLANDESCLVINEMKRDGRLMEEFFG